MKKIILLIIIMFLLVGCGIRNVSSNESASAYTVSNVEEIETNKFANIKGYKEVNLDKYLSYLQANSAAPYEDIVYLINNDINCDYSSVLMDIVKAKYFIKNNLNNYLNYYDLYKDKTVSYVNTGIYNEYYSNMMGTNISKNILMIVNKYYYLSSTYEPNDLRTIDKAYSKGVNNKLRDVAASAFERMAAAAKLDNIIIFNQSAYRSYNVQSNIYNRSVSQYGVSVSDKTSARPGNSEHQTGLALDVNMISDTFETTDAFKWLTSNAYKYGFILRYPKGKDKITGYSYEPWHYRYVGEDIAKQIKDEGITFDEYYAYYLNN